MGKASSALAIALLLCGGCIGPLGKAKGLFSSYRNGDMVAAEHGVLLYGYDCAGGKPIELKARMVTPHRFDGIENAKIGFYDGPDFLGAAWTDDDGLARLAWTPPDNSRHEILARPLLLPLGLNKGVLKIAAPILVAPADPGRPIIVVDLDRTVVDAGTYDMLTKRDPKDMPRSAKVLAELSGQYGIVYLTHRPEYLTRKSKLWLADNHYPRGMLIACDVRQSLQENRQAKSAKLTELRKSGLNLQVGVGDKFSDSQAYMDNGMTAYLIPHYKKSASDMRSCAKEVRELSGPRLQVVEDWDQIERGIVDNERFTAQQFAANLERRAKD